MKDGKYYIQTSRYRETWFIMPGSQRIFVDCGALLVYDEEEELIVAYAPGEWVECLEVEMFEAMHPSPPIEL